MKDYEVNRPPAYEEYPPRQRLAWQQGFRRYAGPTARSVALLRARLAEPRFHQGSVDFGPQKDADNYQLDQSYIYYRGPVEVVVILALTLAAVGISIALANHGLGSVLVDAALGVLVFGLLKARKLLVVFAGVGGLLRLFKALVR